MTPEPDSVNYALPTASACGDIVATVARYFLSAAVMFVAAGVLAVTTASTWSLLLTRVVLIVLGIVALVAGLRARRRTTG